MMICKICVINKNNLKVATSMICQRLAQIGRMKLKVTVSQKEKTKVLLPLAILTKMTLLQIKENTTKKMS